MIIGVDGQGNGHIHMDAGEYERFKNHRIVGKKTEDANGRYVIGCFFQNEPVSKMTKGMIRKFSDDDGVLTINITVDLYELACMGDTLEGLNDYVEEVMDDVRFTDVTYRAVGVDDSNGVIIQVKCHVGEILDDLYPHYFVVKPETNGEGVYYLIGQNEAEFAGWTAGETEDEGGPTMGETLACEPTFEKIMEHAANYNLDKTPVV